MKRSVLIHVSGALLTIIAFVAGSTWSRFSKAGDPREMESATTEAKHVDRGQAATGAAVETMAPSTGAEFFETMTGLSPGEFDPAAGPLREDQIESLVRESIRSLSPVDRRLAFDRLLQEVQLDTFTVEQAALIRSLMVEHGASEEQWRLFDYAWAANHPQAAIAYIDEIPEQYLNGYLGNMLPGLASAAPQMAIDLFESFDADLQGRLRRPLYEGLIHHDLGLATNYVFDSANHERHDWRPMDEFTRQLANELGLQATLDWAAALPEGPLRSNAWSAIFAKWTSQDPVGISQALIEMPVSADRDQAINGFISALAGQDPEGAVTWAAEINDPGLREAAMVRAGTRYFQQNQSAATAWFASSGLPATALSRMSP